ncbi:ATPase [filamentous cyanobacterium CCP5]|nr:ATPase [filamentous cyanobacterium CCP5]
MSQRQIEVRHLDLAPKLNRPLSLWNPLDYVRLIYWMAYFPGALQWYLNTFGEAVSQEVTRDWRQISFLLKNQAIRRNLLIQALITNSLTALLICKLIDSYIATIDWSFSISAIFLATFFFAPISVIFGGIIEGMLFDQAVAISSAIVSGLTANKILSNLSLESSILIGSSFGILNGISYVGLASIAIPRKTISGAVLTSQSGLIISGIFSNLFFLALIPNLQRPQTEAVLMVIATGLLSGIAALGLAILRIDAYVMGFISLGLGDLEAYFKHTSLTPLALPQTKKILNEWLSHDWLKALRNIKELSLYTYYSETSILSALDREFSLMPSDQVIFRFSQLTEYFNEWTIIRFLSASFTNFLNTEFLNAIFILPFRKELASRFNTNLRLDTPAHAVSAGFWLLHNGSPGGASMAFDVVRNRLYGGEMHSLSIGLALFKSAKSAAEIAEVELIDFPENPVLRPVTWNAMQRFCNVVSDTRTVVDSVSRTARAFASNRALGELTHILDYVDEVPEAERQLIKDIALQWREALLDVAGAVGEVTIEQPVRNPYVVGDPVEGSLFVGREDILRQLEELWLMGSQMQSVVIYGHRRMGKTSILRNASKTVGSGLRVIYINMLRSASAESLSDVLIAITDEIADTLAVPAPSDADMMEQPLRTFDRYLKRVIDSLSDSETLIIAIDEFEKIEELIEAGKLSPDFIGHLRGLVQLSPKLGFAFAGLHTLEEMTADYFNPFFVSVIPIRVGFLQPGAVRQLLSNPDLEFPLDYRRDALDRIHQLTAGQPYLVQLVGFQLVRRFNDQVFEQGRSRDRVFTVEDVEIVTEDPEFYNRGRYYFTGVWDQADRDVPHQQAILQALTPHRSGLSLKDLKSRTRLDSADLDKALEQLQRHDVVKVEANQAQIIVELFRRWLQRQP